MGSSTSPRRDPTTDDVVAPDDAQEARLEQQSKDQLEQQARDQAIHGRSHMSKHELAEALVDTVPVPEGRPPLADVAAAEAQRWAPPTKKGTDR